jgi:hypothetical protein
MLQSMQLGMRSLQAAGYAGSLEHCLPFAPMLHAADMVIWVPSAAERLAEQLDLCGIKKEALSSRARLSLQLLASIASKLQLAEARPELVLAAWAALLVKESRAAAMLVSCNHCSTQQCCCALPFV